MATSDPIRLPLTGGCQCGAVRYSITSAPVAFYWCHCTECQRPSGAAFGEPLRVRRADVQITGTLQQWSRRTEFGKRHRAEYDPRFEQFERKRTSVESPAPSVCRSFSASDTSHRCRPGCLKQSMWDMDENRATPSRRAAGRGQSGRTRSPIVLLGPITLEVSA